MKAIIENAEKREAEHADKQTEFAKRMQELQKQMDHTLDEERKINKDSDTKHKKQTTSLQEKINEANHIINQIIEELRNHKCQSLPVNPLP